ncbi:CocE/NonD family hydrolase [Siphonobacter aquaeclarae]|nr:CocE/NonD family hydrolase [Siphonobacter aquaeclarae]
MRFLLLFLCLLCGRAMAQAPLAGHPDYVVQDSVLIPARDGYPIVSTIVSRKGTPAPGPAVLFFTTYYQGKRDANLFKTLADRGYTGIIAYCRGLRTDVSRYRPFEHDAADCHDVIDWISRQPWCNGRIGMFGGSYTGYVQWAMAKQPHPALKTIVPQVAVYPGLDFPMENNIPLPGILSWANDNIRSAPPLPRDLVFRWYESGAPYRQLDSLAGISEPVFQNWLAHPAYDRYWSQLVPTDAELKAFRIPILVTTGYYDGSQIGAMAYLHRYLSLHANPDVHVVIGPYDHWGGQRRPSPELMGYKIDSVANVSMALLAYDWLDHILKGTPKPDLLKKRLAYQVMGTNTWKHAESLAPATETRTFFVTPGGLLTPAKTSNTVSGVITTDLRDRSDSAQHNYFTPVIVREEVPATHGLIFRSAPFARATTLAGSFSGELSVSLNRRDADLSVAFYEEQADGKCFYLTRYLGRASYAADPSRRQLLRPGKRTPISLRNIRFVSKRFEKGSRLLVIVDLNKHPFEILNYGSGKDVADESMADAGVLKVTLLSGSYIRMPCLD